MKVAPAILHLVSCLVLLAACMKMESSTPETPDNPDGVDPPQLNPQPTDIVPVRVIAPKTLKIALEAFYYAPSIPVSPWFCVKDRAKPVDPRNTGHMRRVPIPLQFDGTEYRGIFVEDRFLPGRCLWGFPSAMG